MRTVVALCALSSLALLAFVPTASAALYECTVTVAFWYAGVSCEVDGGSFERDVALCPYAEEMCVDNDALACYVYVREGSSIAGHGCRPA